MTIQLKVVVKYEMIHTDFFNDVLYVKSGETHIHVEINNNFNRLQSTLSQQQRVTYII